MLNVCSVRAKQELNVGHLPNSVFINDLFSLSVKLAGPFSVISEHGLVELLLIRVVIFEALMHMLSSQPCNRSLV